MYCKVHSAKELPNFNLKACKYVSELGSINQSIHFIDFLYCLRHFKRANDKWRHGVILLIVGSLQFKFFFHRT